MALPVRSSLFAAVLLLSGLAPAPAARAQAHTSIGVGFNTVLSTAQGLGLGFRFRGARALNDDVSIAAGMGLTGFVLGGRDDADYLFDPQVSLIVTLGGPVPDRATYVLGGFGAYVPVGGDHQDRTGPTIHAGMGWVRGLYATRLFYELDPAIVIGESRVDLIFPFRLGVIF